jgi:hypothetical protein
VVEFPDRKQPATEEEILVGAVAHCPAISCVTEANMRTEIKIFSELYTFFI